jgi:hypothetical protein
VVRGGREGEGSEEGKGVECLEFVCAGERWEREKEGERREGKGREGK